MSSSRSMTRVALIAKGKIDGVRVDHSDGLYDPRHYLLHLQERFVLACARLEFDADSAKFGGDWDRNRRELSTASASPNLKNGTGRRLAALRDRRENLRHGRGPDRNLGDPWYERI